MLTKAMKKYVKSKGKGYTKEIQSVYNNRLKSDILEAIKDLTLTLDNLPEKQLEHVFSVANLKPFFTSLFRLTESNRKRVLGLWRLLLLDVANTTYVLNFVGRERLQMLTKRKPTELEALYSTVMFEE